MNVLDYLIDTAAADIIVGAASRHEVICCQPWHLRRYACEHSLISLFSLLYDNSFNF